MANGDLLLDGRHHRRKHVGKSPAPQSAYVWRAPLHDHRPPFAASNVIPDLPVCFAFDLDGSMLAALAEEDCQLI